jgi:multiple sugar transport system permease protein
MTAAATPRTRRRRRLGVDALIRIVYLVLFLVFLLVQLYWVLVTSIKPVDDYMAIPPVWFPSSPTIIHFTAALFSYRGLDGLVNSVIVSTAATALSVLLGTLMGYSFARFNTGGQHLSFWVLSQRFLPPVAVVLPVFLLYRSWGLNDTRIGLILMYTVMTLPLSVWMMYAYFRQMPPTLEEAALVDGCSRWRAFWKVALPLAVPGIVAAAIFAFIFCWTEFFFALILTSRKAFTLPTIFRSFLGFQASMFGESSALSIVSLVPSIVLGMLVQRHLVRGLTLGAVQG